MEPIKKKIEEFELDNFINYYLDNVGELLEEYPDIRKGIELIDKDYLDVINFDEDYENFKSSNDYKEALLSEEYALHFIIGKTYEGNEKIEIIDGMKYSLMHYLDDLYGDADPIKDIGDLNLDLDHFVGLLIDFENDELEISVVNYEHGSKPSIVVVEDSGDLEEILKAFIGRFEA